MKAYTLRILEAQVRHANEAAAIEADVNRHLGGECTIGELVGVMLERGWMPPDTISDDDADLPSAADVRGIMAPEQTPIKT